MDLGRQVLIKNPQHKISLIRRQLRGCLPPRAYLHKNNPDLFKHCVPKRQLAPRRIIESNLHRVFPRHLARKQNTVRTCYSWLSISDLTLLLLCFFIFSMPQFHNEVAMWRLCWFPSKVGGWSLLFYFYTVWHVIPLCSTIEVQRPQFLAPLGFFIFNSSLK
jgi:hypothetical protein